MNDIERLRQQKTDRFAKMGLPVAAGQMNKITENTAGGGSGAHKTLQDIKRGVQKQSFGKFIKASKEATTVEGYQIPEQKSKNQPKAAPSKNAVAPQKFTAKPSAEANSLEDMMSGDVTMSSTRAEGAAPTGNIINQSYENTGFDPVAHLKSKIAQGTQTQPQVVQEQSYGSPSEMKEMIDILLENQKSNNDAMIQEMKAIALNTVKQVIGDFLEDTKKNKNIYEIYNKKANVVKIKGSLFKLTPVKIKGH